eukprot:COSAG03_NODE_804_length_5790_cov_54.606923_3_plen_218_part_00
MGGDRGEERSKISDDLSWRISRSTDEEVDGDAHSPEGERSVVTLAADLQEAAAALAVGRRVAEALQAQAAVAAAAAAAARETQSELEEEHTRARHQTELAKNIQRWWTDAVVTADDETVTGDSSGVNSDSDEIRRIPIPKQRNPDGTVSSTDCGVMVCAAIRRLLLVTHAPRQMQDWGFRGNDGEMWRSYIALDLHAGKIVPRQHELQEGWRTQATW